MGIKIYDIDDLTPEQAEAYSVASGLQGYTINRRSGIMNTIPIEKNLNYVRSPAEEIVPAGGGQNNAQICFGRDRPNLIPGDGYGKIGAMNASAIDIVVGRMSSQLKNLEENAWVNPSFKADAARIHISQLTDIDFNFGLNEGLLPNSIGKSGIGIKADGVRVIGRQGIKLVTGGWKKEAGSPPETNSLGQPLPTVAPLIELNAGNIEHDGLPGGPVQGIARGDNVVDCLDELVDHLDSLIGQLDTFITLQVQINSTIMPVVAPLLGPAGGAKIFKDIVSEIAFSKGKLHPIRYQLRRPFRNLYLSPQGDRYIPSENVVST